MTEENIRREDRHGTVLEPPASLFRVSRETMQERVYAALRGAIMRGEIKPGQNLTIPGLAATFGTSSMPVREALFRLSAERALTVVAGRSVGVPALSRSRLRDLTRVRVEVEGFAAAWASEHASEETIGTLRELVELMWEDSEAEDAQEFLSRNQSFHFSIYRATGSQTLVPIIESLWLQIGPYLRLLHRSGTYRSGNAHHEALYKAILNGNPQAARKALEGDILSAAEALLPLISQD